MLVVITMYMNGLCNMAKTQISVLTVKRAQYDRKSVFFKQKLIYSEVSKLFTNEL